MQKKKERKKNLFYKKTFFLQPIKVIIKNRKKHTNVDDIKN